MLSLRIQFPGRLHASLTHKQNSDKPCSSSQPPRRPVSRSSSQDSDATLINSSRLDSGGSKEDDPMHLCSSPLSIKPSHAQMRNPGEGKKRRLRLGRWDSSAFVAGLDIAISIGEATNVLYLKNIAGIVKIVLKNVQATKNNREQCERICFMVSDIATLVQEWHARTSGKISSQLDQNTSALESCCHQITSALQKYSKRKYIIRFLNAQKDIDLLRDCEKELDKTLRIYHTRASIRIAAAVKKRDTLDENFRNAAFDLLGSVKHPSLRVQTVPATTTTLPEVQEQQLQDRLHDLPPSPQIFHGRSTELQHLLCLLTSEKPQSHAAICGPFGVGKTHLAQALIHTPEIKRVFGFRRYFIGCERMKTLDDLKGSLTGIFVETPPGDQVVRVFSGCSGVGMRCLLVLDNLESIWEPSDNRLIIEDFLTDLSSIPNISLVITLRGTQRPLGPDWIKPYLPPLHPFNTHSAKETFLAVSGLTESTHDNPDPDIEFLLNAVENSPLAVTLLAKLAQYEPISSLRERFEDPEEGLSMLCLDDGTDLGTVLRGLLGDPRVVECPNAVDVFHELCSCYHHGSDMILRTQFVGRLDSIPKFQSIKVRRCLSALIQASLVQENRQGYLTVSRLMRSAVCTQ